MSTKNARRARKKEKQRQVQLAKATSSAAAAPQVNDQKNSAEPAKHPVTRDSKSDTKRQWPWMYLVAAGGIAFHFLITDHSFILAWTQDSPVNWDAQICNFLSWYNSLDSFRSCTRRIASTRNVSQIRHERRSRSVTANIRKSPIDGIPSES